MTFVPLFSLIQDCTFAYSVNYTLLFSPYHTFLVHLLTLYNLKIYNLNEDILKLHYIKYNKYRYLRHTV